MDIQELGPYELKEILGKGGMGTVYRGVAKATGEEVAVKVLAPFYADHDDFRERFTTEIRSLEKLRHPRIVTLYGHGEENGLLFYVMELVHGHSLQDELTQGREFHWREVCQIGADICAALKQAHDHGIIHRDIKPANLLLDEHGRAKLSDFGIAKMFGDKSLTVGGVLGTVDYMAPEQAEGLPTTPKCDIYSMGAVLYTLLAGQAPFRGKTVAEVLQKLRFDEPIPVSRFNVETPSELESIISQLLEKDPAVRIPTAFALAKRLQALYETPTAELNNLSASADDVGFAERSDQHDDKLADMRTIAADDSGQAPAHSGQTARASTAETSDSRAAFSGDRPRAKSYIEVDGSGPAIDPVTEERSESTLQTVITWSALLASLGLVVFVVALALRRPSADQLFDQITTALETGDKDQLQKQGDAVVSFLGRFPNDDRGPMVRRINAQIVDRDKMQRLQARLRKGERNAGSRSLLENRLLAAMQLEDSDPRAATARYQAILDLFDSPDDTDQDSLTQHTQTDLLQFARQRLRKLETSQTTLADKYRAQLKQQLARAEQLATDDVDAARRIWQAIIRLYQDDVWADDLIVQARQRLAEISE